MAAAKPPPLIQTASVPGRCAIQPGRQYTALLVPALCPQAYQGDDTGQVEGGSEAAAGGEACAFNYSYVEGTPRRSI